MKSAAKYVFASYFDFLMVDARVLIVHFDVFIWHSHLALYSHFFFSTHSYFAIPLRQKGAYGVSHVLS